MRYLVVESTDADEVSKYLPSNYEVVGPSQHDDDQLVVVGEDVAGWTLEGYVIPRLASGMIYSEVLDIPPDV